MRIITLLASLSSARAALEACFGVSRQRQQYGEATFARQAGAQAAPHLLHSLPARVGCAPVCVHELGDREGGMRG